MLGVQFADMQNWRSAFPHVHPDARVFASHVFFVDSCRRHLTSHAHPPHSSPHLQAGDLQLPPVAGQQVGQRLLRRRHLATPALHLRETLAVPAGWCAGAVGDSRQYINAMWSSRP